MRIVSRLIWLVAVMTCIGTFAGTGRAQSLGDTDNMHVNTTAPTLTVDGTVALASLITIGDGHLLKLTDQIKMLATRQEVVTGDWNRIKPLLAKVADQNAPALLWFALPSGEYRTVQHGKVKANLGSRPYFPRLLAGETVIGELVVSKSTGKNTAIVAVPVFQKKKVVGMLGASVYLDKLSERIKQEMSLPRNMIFYSFDSKPLLALVWDQGLIFTEPKALGADVDKAFREMLKNEEGTVTYSFRGKTRQVLFRKSPVTNWRYAIGVVQEEAGSGKAQ